MTEIQIMTAMNQSVINKITEFKNKEIKKEELNNFMFANLSYILTQRKKIKKRNEKIKKDQDIEVKKALAKVKSFNGILVFNSDELESKPIMNKLVNPTLDVYIPLSEISYTTEMKMYNVENGQITASQDDAGFSFSKDTVVKIPEFYYKVNKDTGA